MFYFRLKRYGHIGKRREEEHVVRRVLEAEIAGKRRGRPNTRWKNAGRRDMRIVDLREDDVRNMRVRRRKINSYTGEPE